MADICKFIVFFALNVLQTTLIDVSTKTLLEQTLESKNVAATSLDKSTVAFYHPIVQNTTPEVNSEDVVTKAQADGIKPEETSITTAVIMNPKPFLNDKMSTTTSIMMSGISMGQGLTLPSFPNRRAVVTPALEKIVTTEKITDISSTTNFIKILTSNKVSENPYVKSVLPAIPSSPNASAITTANANYNRNKALGMIRGSGKLKFASADSTTLPWVPFSTTTFETSSWVNFSTVTTEINPNCSGLMVDMVRKITYCTNIWGQSYRSISVDSTTQAAVTGPVKDIWEILVDKQDLPHFDTSITINLLTAQIALEMFCPESVNCPVAQNDSEKTNSCCIPCDCFEACINSNTCCLNKKHTDTNNRVIGETTEKCVKTYMGDLSQNKGLQSSSTFMLIQGCPEENNDVIDSDTKVKCIDSNIKFLDETVPFYSSKTNRSYRNIHCARCNIDFEFGNYWESYLSCASFDCFNSVFKNSIGMTRSLTDWLISNIWEMAGGMLYWKPPSNNVKKCVAQDIVISTCNINNKYSRSLEEICFHYYAPVRGRYGVYRNWFCLLCNDDGDNSVWNCKRDESDLFTAKISLDTFLNSAISGPEEKKNVSSGCGNGLHFDTSLNECVRKSCAITKVDVNGRCFPIMTHMSKISLDYRLNVAYPINFIPPMEYILNKVRTLSLQPNDDGNCVERILRIETREDQIMVMIQLLKRVTELRNIQTEFQAFKQRVVRMNDNAVKEQSQLEVDIAETPLSPIKEGYVSFSTFSDVTLTSQCGSPLAMSELQFCDIIMIDEFTRIFNGIVYIKNAAFMPGEYIANSGSKTENLAHGKDDTKSVSICYDLYVSRMMESKGDIKTTNVNTIKNGVTCRLLSDKWLCVFVHLIILFCNLLISGFRVQ